MSNNEPLSHYAKTSDGPYCPFRDHDTKYGWGVRYQPNGAVFALVGAKGVAFGLAAALNGHWDAAQVFIGGDVPLLDADYMRRFLPNTTEGRAYDELLATLRALVAGVERDDNPRDEGHSEHSDEMNAARAAIAKAEGR